MKKKEIKPDWRLVRCDQTSMCGEEWVAKKGIEACGVIYLIDVNLHVHICSFTPCLEAWPVQAFAEFKDDASYEKDESETEMEMLNSEEPCSYLDTRWEDAPFISAEKYMPEREEGETDEDYRMRAADAVREHLAGDPIDSSDWARKSAGGSHG